MHAFSILMDPCGVYVCVHVCMHACMYVCVMYMYMHSEKGVQSLTPPCIVHGTQATLANDQMIQLWKALDDNGNGRIDAGEFGRFMKRGQQAPPSTTPRQRAIAKRVATVAAAKAGEQRQALEEKSRFEGVRRATSEEAATISTLLNERIMMLFPHQEPTDVWYRLFKLADTSDKGRISYAELEVLVRSDTRGLNMSPSTLSTPLLKSLWLALIASQAPAPREEHQVKSSQVTSSQVKSSQVKSSQVLLDVVPQPLTWEDACGAAAMRADSLARIRPALLAAPAHACHTRVTCSPCCAASTRDDRPMNSHRQHKHRAHGAAMSRKSSIIEVRWPARTEVWKSSWKPNTSFLGFLSTYRTSPGAYTAKIRDVSRHADGNATVTR